MASSCILKKQNWAGTVTLVTIPVRGSLMW